MQPGEIACTETLTIVGPKGHIERVRVLGPYRKKTQVEVSLTEARILGVKVPIRNSGDLEGSAPIKLVNPGLGNVVELTEGLIVAQAHLHMSPEDADFHLIKKGQRIKVQLTEGLRPIVIELVCRPQDGCVLEAHIDTDEANAASLTALSYGRVLWQEYVHG
jgi:putative phosphotransacetylase